jgi:hypothetical protein
MKHLLLIIILGGMSVASYGQETAEPKNDTWYVWLHATATIDGKETLVVSKDVFTTYCCVNSPKFAKVLKRTEKWMKKNIDPAFTGSTLQKVQDLELANQTLARLKATEGVHIVDFIETCK